MAGAGTWVDASVCWLTGLMCVCSVAFAESSEYMTALSAREEPHTVMNALPQGTYAQSCTEPDRRTLDAIVPVATDNGSHASGTVIDDNRVLTAAHALHGAGHFFVRVGAAFVLLIWSWSITRAILPFLR